MNSDHDKSRPWRPRWSVRAVLFLVTLTCAYLACWGPTNTTGVADVANRVAGHCQGCVAKFPLVVVGNVFEVLQFSDGTPVIGPEGGELGSFRRCYYFWFFGYVAQVALK